MERKRVIFLLQNGIGFGHFKLALTIATRFDPTCYEIVFLSQAKSTRIFKGYAFKVYNFPPVYALKTNNEILLINTLINRLLETLKPNLVIEDTYPDTFYLNLPALINIPKALIVNRLTASEFESYYYTGLLGQYDKLVVLKKKEEFVSGISTIEIRNFAAHSDRFAYCGNVFNEPSQAQCLSVREKYSFSNFDRTIVVNCGAGGWHIGENVCKDIFKHVIEAANIINANSQRVQFILLIGPYSSYLKEQLAARVKVPKCVRFVDFDDNLDALFHEADLVVLRPGYNSTMEALAGKGRVLLLPGISYLEEQSAWCEELRQRYGIEYVSAFRLEELPNAIGRQMALPAPTRRSIVNNVQEAMEALAGQIEEQEWLYSIARMLVLNLEACRSESVRREVEMLREWDIAYFEAGQVTDGEQYIEVINIEEQWEHRDTLGVVAVYLDERLDNRNLSFFQQRYHYQEQGIVVLPMTEIVIEDASYSIVKLRNVLRNPGRYSECVVLKLVCQPQADKQVLNFLEALQRLLREGKISNISLCTWMCEQVNSRLGTYRFEHNKPEIAKLK